MMRTLVYTYDDLNQLTKLNQINWLAKGAIACRQGDQ